jgi:hypothetical protein
MAISSKGKARSWLLNTILIKVIKIFGKMAFSMTGEDKIHDKPEAHCSSRK